MEKEPYWKKVKHPRESISLGSTTPTTFTPSFSIRKVEPTLTLTQPVQTHLMELWTVLRRIVKNIFLLTIIVLVFPTYQHGHFMVAPFRPLILDIINTIINFALNSMISGANVQIFIGSPLTPISLYINVGLLIAAIVSLPITIKELYGFLLPALTPEEAATLKQIAYYFLVLFVFGVLLSYFLIVPITLRILAFTGGTIGKDVLVQMYSLDSIISLLFWASFGGGLLYASPLVLVAMVDLGIITPEQLEKRRREMIFVIFFIAAVVTPDPTIVSMVILSVPMVAVIELIIAWSFRMQLRKLTKRSD